jgi:hypothetical protein
MTANGSSSRLRWSSPASGQLSITRRAITSGIEFGVDSRFLPQPGIEGSLRMVQSNVRSLLHLVGEIDGNLDLERRQLWSESGVNFAEVLAQSVGSFHVN